MHTQVKSSHNPISGSTSIMGTAASTASTASELAFMKQVVRLAGTRQGGCTDNVCQLSAIADAMPCVAIPSQLAKQSLQLYVANAAVATAALKAVFSGNTQASVEDLESAEVEAQIVMQLARMTNALVVAGKNTCA